MTQQRQELFALYAANIAAGFNAEVSAYNAKGQLEWFDHYAIHPNPPAEQSIKFYCESRYTATKCAIQCEHCRGLTL